MENQQYYTITFLRGINAHFAANPPPFESTIECLPHANKSNIVVARVRNHQMYVLTTCNFCLFFYSYHTSEQSRVGSVDQTVSMPRTVRTAYSTMLFVTSGHGLADRSSASVRRPVAQGAALDRCRRSTIITPKSRHYRRHSETFLLSLLLARLHYL